VLATYHKNIFYSGIDEFQYKYIHKRVFNPSRTDTTNHQRELTARLAETLEGGPELSGARPARTEWIPGPYLPP